MDIHKRLQECFHKLGYSADFPSTLHVNSSTNYIWQQLINRVKPRNEVIAIRANLIMHRLGKKSDVKNPIQVAIREIQVYDELKTVKERIKGLKTIIQEKRNKSSILQQTNKTNYLIVDDLKEKVEEKKMKIHMLQLKFENIECETKEIEEMINYKGLITITEEESCPTEVVMKKLGSVVENLERKAKNPIILKLAQSQHSNFSQHSNSRVLRSHKGCYSTIKKDVAFKQLQKFRSCTNVNSARVLFKECIKESEMNIGNVTNRVEGIKGLDQSIEILPDSCFDFRADDEFLTSFQTSYKNQSVKIDTVQNESIFGNSMKLSCQTSSRFLMEMKQKPNVFEQAISSQDIVENIEDLLNTANKTITWSALCSLRENLLDTIKVGLESSKKKVSFRTSEIDETDIINLNFIHIKNSLLTLKNKKQIKRLKSAIDKEKSDIQKQLREHFGEDRIKTLDLQLENISLDAAIEYIYQEINANSRSDTRRILMELNNSISNKKEDLATKLREIEEYRATKEDLMDRIKSCQDDTQICSTKLTKFIFDPEWAAALTESIHLNEIQVFQNFPIDFNKRYCFTNNDIFYRDSLKGLKLDESTSSDTLYMLTALLEHPQNTPELILREILRKKNKLEIFKSLHFPTVGIEKQKHCLKDLEDQEKYVDKICESLVSHIRSIKANQIFSSSSHLKLNMQLWIEMPFGRYLSRERVVKGKTFKDYEKDFDYFRST